MNSEQEHKRSHILQLKVKNVKCLKEVVLDQMGDIVDIRGDAGQGKTSILDSIEGAINGLAPDMIRRGEEKAEIELHLTDTVIKRIRDMNEDTLMVQHKGAPVERGREFLRAIYGPSAFRPLRWVQMGAGPKRGSTERLRVQRTELLEALTMQMDEEDVVSAVKRKLGDSYLENLGALSLGGVEFDQHPFVVCGQFQRICGERRSDLNREADYAESVLKTMLPPDVPAPSADLETCKCIEEEATAAYLLAKGAAGNRQSLQGRIARLEGIIQEEDTHLPDVKDLKTTEREYSKLNDACVKEMAALREKLDLAEAQHREYQVKLKACAEYRERLEDQDARKEDLRRLHEEMAQGSDVELDILEKAMVEARIDRQAREVQDRYDAASRAYEEAKGKAKRYQELVDFFRNDMPKLLLEQADLPVEGLGVDDDQVTINGIPLHQLGTSEQIRVGVQIAAALNPRSGFVLIDGAESLGRKDRLTLAEEAQRMGLQLIMTYVDPDAEGSCDAVVMEEGVRKLAS